MLSIKSDSKETYYTHSKKYLRQRNIKVKQIIFLQKMQSLYMQERKAYLSVSFDGTKFY